MALKRKIDTKERSSITTGKPAGKKTLRRIPKAAIDRILAQHAAGTTLMKASIAEGFSYSGVWEWLQRNDPAGYARARQASARAMLDKLHDEIEAETNLERVQLLKLKADMVRWTASKVDPKTFGDKIQTEHSGSLGLKRLPDDYSDEELTRAIEK